MRIRGITLTKAERKAGLLMRAPDHPTGDSGGAPANSGVIPDSNGTQTPDGNNAGQSFDPASFWDTPSPDGTGSPARGSADSAPAGGGSTGTQGNADPGQEIGQRFATQLQSLAFAPVFSNEVAQQIADGNLEGVNGAITQLGRDSVRNAVTMSAQLMQVHGQHILSQVEAMIQDRLGGRDNDAALEQAFPQLATNPAMRPMVTEVFAQAMKHSGGKREAALDLTRTMLKFMGQGVNKELGLTEPAGSSSDNIGSGAMSLVEELLAR